MKRLALFLIIIAGIWAPTQVSAQLFNDVPETHWAFSFIETLATNGITSGCGGGDYCPINPVSRAQMAVFLERGINGSNYSPAPATGTVFDDVSAGYFGANFIEQLADDGITSGCGNNNYCPDATVSRAQMAVFLLRAKYGADYRPPTAVGVFTDVPLNHWAAGWIEQLAAEGITSGCGQNIYCPDGEVSRAAMAVFLVRIFDLSYIQSSNASLLNLDISTAALDQTFQFSTQDYTAVVGFLQDFVSIETETHPYATVIINGVQQLAGLASTSIPLEEGQNQISIDVTSQDGLETNTYTLEVTRENASTFAQVAYAKASNTDTGDSFGSAVALDGDTIVIGASLEGSSATGVDGDQNNEDNMQSGAAYVFVRDTNGEWSQQAYIKASNAGLDDRFGTAVALSGDTLAVSAINDDSSATGVNGDEDDYFAQKSGAVYVFTRINGVWNQQAYIKASNTDYGDEFGAAIALSDDTLVVGAVQERSSATGVNGDEADNSAPASGAVYVFARTDGVWSQQAYIKASNAEASDLFGYAVDVSDDTIVVGATREDGSSNGVNGDQSGNFADASGAAYVFTRSGTIWSQQAYLKASNTGLSDVFGSAVAIDGDTLAVAATSEDSAATGVNGDQMDESSQNSGAVYVFTRNVANIWSQQAYVKASNNEASDGFGYTVDLANDTLIVASIWEDSAGTGLYADQWNNDASSAGAVYLFKRDGTTWAQQAYMKASNTDLGDAFGLSIALSGDEVLVGTGGEDSATTGINSYSLGGQGSNAKPGSGAAYIFATDIFPSSSAALGSLSVSSVFLDQPFDPDQHQYTTTVHNSIDEVFVTATLADSAISASSRVAEVTINGELVDSGVASSSITLLPGVNIITVEVLAEDRIVGSIYTIEITWRAVVSTDAQAYDISLSSGSLDQIFDPLQTNYTTSVGFLQTCMAITVDADLGANVIVNSVLLAKERTSECISLDEGENIITITITAEDGVTSESYTVIVTRQYADAFAQQAYVKASNAEGNDRFGYSVALSGDTLAVGAPFEKSRATGINGDQTDDLVVDTGAVYVFTRDGAGTWSQQAYVKASNTGTSSNIMHIDFFGYSVALSGDTLAVGAPREHSLATGINGSQANNSADWTGAVYVFTRDGIHWSQQAYVKASNTNAGDAFGQSVALSGNTLAVGASSESSAATGINGNQADNTATAAGAVYVFTRDDTLWSQQAYVKASNTDATDLFGSSVVLSGNTLAVGASGEESAATGINGDESNDNATNSGAVYVFTRDGATWSQQAYVKASNTDANDAFGSSIALYGDTLAVGAYSEDSASTGINGDEADNTVVNAGAVYVFTRDGMTWSQQAYVKASGGQGEGDDFGGSVALSDDTLAVAGLYRFNDWGQSPMVYVFTRDTMGIWNQQMTVNPQVQGFGDMFGDSIALDGDTLAIGAPFEDSAATGVNGNEADNTASGAGAVYMFE